MVGDLRGRVGGGKHRSIFAGRIDKQIDEFKELLPAELAEINIPGVFGHVEERFVGQDPRFILITQDIHANYEAQQNLSQILQFLQTGKTRGNFQLLALEGADAQIDPSLFKAMADVEIRSQLIDAFMKEGSLTGAERFVIEAKTPVKGIGVEKTQAYMENLGHFRNAQKQKEGIRSELLQIQNILCKLKPMVFTPELIEINEKANQFENCQIQLTDYCGFLSKQSGLYGVVTGTFPNFTTVNEMAHMEKSYDQEKAQAEKLALVEALQDKLVQEDRRVLLEKTFLFKLGKISSIEFYGYVMELARKVKINLDAYPNFTKFADTANIFDKIAIRSVNKECGEILTQIKDKLYKNPEQRDLDELDMHIASMNRLLDLALTREELARYEAGREKWTGPAMEKFLARMCANYGIPSPSNVIASPEVLPSLRGAAGGGDAAILSLPSRLAEMNAFYDVALERDDILLDNTLTTMEKEKKKTAVLVVGGFHSNGVAEKLKAKGISYVMVTPRFVQDDSEKVYLSQMMDEETPFQQFLERKGSRLGMLLKLAGRGSVLGEENKTAIESFLVEAATAYLALVAAKTPQVLAANKCRTEARTMATADSNEGVVGVNNALDSTDFEVAEESGQQVLKIPLPQGPMEIIVAKAGETAPQAAGKVVTNVLTLGDTILYARFPQARAPLGD